MAKFLVYLGLFLLCVIRIVHAQDDDDGDDISIFDLFSIHQGRFASCDQRLNTLEDYHQESIDSLARAIDAIDTRWEEQSPSGDLIRAAMFQFFRVRQRDEKLRKAVSDDLESVFDFLNGLIDDIPRDTTWFFCGSDFIVQREPTIDEALDEDGNGIIVDRELITISRTIMLCPQAFDTPDKPATYRAGSLGITAGATLEDWLPRSTTFLHEMFHVVFGTKMLEGGSEKYLLAEVVQLAQVRPGNARKNPESYIYFVAAMHYLFGAEEEGVPTKWNFAEGADAARVV
ncbi:hypothetical protein S7711_11526 [Stachybotrys chartarum IBT 7711]|uniref:Lysine-specific metallo-endopeptidase domain-containing protein n=1 Tax=Stachybotrys chartarum (strain CBS 109288 / IBT 7711) TaxID=1280523 RepID=A0A084AEY2_STACB|nr:hypothetical protein S7711_11526 [Stachybotrys chartarum IBT 7711]